MYIKDLQFLGNDYEEKRFCFIDGEAAQEDTSGADSDGDGAGDADAGGSSDGDAGGAAGGSDDNVIWPDNWRDTISGGDEKKAARLARFDSPTRMFNSYLELEQTHQKADIRSPFPEEGSDSEKNVWRENSDIPLEAAGYLESLPEGMTVPDEDKAGMETLATAMHAVHAPKNYTHAAMGAYYKHVQTVQDFQVAQDADNKKNTDDILNQEYGKEYRININDVGNWLGEAGGSIKEAFLDSRTPDGTKFGNNPEVVKWLIGKMRQERPISTTPGVAQEANSESIQTEIDTIEKVIQNDNATYQGDKKMQERYLNLLDAKEKRKA